MIKAVLCDFDGTVVTKDLLDLLSESIGKKEESARLNAMFHSGELPGLTGIITRINFLTGMAITDIVAVIEKANALMPGAVELFEYLRRRGITSILLSGNIEPVLKIYQQKLGIDYIIGSKPKIKNGTLQGISESDYPPPVADQPFKLTLAQQLLQTIDILPEECVALGDSPADIATFQYCGYSLAIRPTGDTAQYADKIIENLCEAIPFIEHINSA